MPIDPEDVIRVTPPTGSDHGLATNRDHTTGVGLLTDDDLSLTTSGRLGVWMGHTMIVAECADHGEVADEAAMLALHDWSDDPHTRAVYHYVAPGDSCTRADDPGYRWHCLSGHGHYLTDWERRPLPGPIADLASRADALEVELATKIGSSALDGYATTASVTDALTGKANATHTHSLSQLTQSGATLGQVATWTGTGWAPAAAPGGGTSGELPSGGYPGYTLTMGASGAIWVPGGQTCGVWSVRKVFGGYSGPCIRLQRGSDSAESDFGFSGSWLDSAAVAAWAGGSLLYVSRVYNQYGGPDLVYSGSRPPFSLARSETNGRPSWMVDPSAKLTCEIGSNGVRNGIIGGVVAPIGSQGIGTYQVAAAILYWPESGSWGTMSVSITDGEIGWRFGSGQQVSGNSRARTASNGLCAAVAEKVATEERIWLNGAQLGATATGRAPDTAANSTTLRVGGGDYGDQFANAYVCELIYYRLSDLGGAAYTAAAVAAYGL